ncbi:MAG: hypothetical protein MHPSP_001196 [Paramarteilia canceri]
MKSLVNAFFDSRIRLANEALLKLNVIYQNIAETKRFDSKMQYLYLNGILHQLEGKFNSKSAHDSFTTEELSVRILTQLCQFYLKYIMKEDIIIPLQSDSDQLLETFNLFLKIVCNLKPSGSLDNVQQNFDDIINENLYSMLMVLNSECINRFSSIPEIYSKKLRRIFITFEMQYILDQIDNEHQHTNDGKPLHDKNFDNNLIKSQDNAKNSAECIN